jgi:SAM-dependent methyltransferase
MEDLFSGLYDLRKNSSIESWRHISMKTCRNHSLLPLLHRDPFTKRIFSKPRGYAGDATTIDFIYAREFPESLDCIPELKETCSIGKEVYNYTSEAPESRAVRERKKILEDYLQKTVADKTAPKILSVACGHLRELAAIRPHIADCSITAVDNDLLSLEVVNREYAHLGVKAACVSVKDIIKGQVTGLDDFDFIYAAGLYDYLNDPVAQALTLRLFDMLASGGKLLVANFLPERQGVGYMEAMMDWWLIYRKEEELPDFAAQIPKEQIAGVKTFAEKNDVIGFLEISKQ